MREHSEDYYLLKILLTNPQDSANQIGLHPDYENIQEAKVLATLLAHSQLATPRLNQVTVEAFLDGKQGWPQVGGGEYFVTEKTPISFEKMKELGLVSFYAGWLRTHLKVPHNQDGVHDTVKPLLDIMQTLEGVGKGDQNLLKPHFKLPTTQADSLLKSLVPDGYLESCKCLHHNESDLLIQFETQQKRNVLPLYLWREIRKIEPSIEDAFSHWCDVLLVYFGTLMMPNINDLTQEERQEFDTLFLNRLYTDTELNTVWKTLQNRWLLGGRADHLIAQSTHLDELINTWVSRHTEEQDIWGEISWHQEHNTYFIFRTPYEPILLAYVELNLRIESHRLSAPDSLEKLFALTLDKPVMVSILFSTLLEFSQSPNFAIYLLSRPETAAIGANHILNKSMQTWGRSPKTSVMMNIQKECAKLVADNVLRHVEKNNYAFLEDIITLLRNYSQRSAREETQKSFLPDYFIQNFVENITVEKIKLLTTTLETSLRVRKSNSSGISGDLHLVFLLLKKLLNEGLSNESPEAKSLQAIIIDTMKRTFQLTWNNEKDLYLPWNRIITLPWSLLNEGNSIALLDILPNSKLIEASLEVNPRENMSYNDCSDNREIIIFLLQPLIVISRQDIDYPRSQHGFITQIRSRLLQIIERSGFYLESSTDNGEYGLPLFEKLLHEQGLDLWIEICISANYFSDGEFDRLLDVFNSGVSVRRILELYQHTRQGVRKEKILEKIKNKLFRDVSDEGLNNLEQAFLIAINSNLTELADSIANAGDQFILERFGAFPKNHDLKTRFDEWSLYKYESVLIEISHDDTLSINQKQQRIINSPIPDFHTKGTFPKHVEQFKRYILAIVLIEEDPNQSCQMLEQLIKENRNDSYVDNWFVAYLNKLESEEAEQSDYRKTLQKYKKTLSDFSPSTLSLNGTQSYLSCLLILHDYSEIEVCWLSLTEEKQYFLPIATIYCRKLKDSGEVLKAIELLETLKKYHQHSEIPKEQQSLLDELHDIITNDVEPKKLAIAIRAGVGGKRSTDELRRDFDEIKSQSFESLSQIISDKSFKGFLYDNVTSVCRELLLRVANLRAHNNSEERYRITKEDIINDWFTSLFNHRLHTWGIRCEDQKRLGDSQNSMTSNPGELDGYITASGEGVAVFEAFRLFSLDTTVITEHLNKLAGYNSVGVDPIFVVAYCQVSDFSSLCEKYRELISKQSYSEFSIPIDREKDEPTNQGRLFTFAETRKFRSQEVTFFHLLLDLKQTSI